MKASGYASTLLWLAILTSGSAALCCQVVWQQGLTQSIGSDAISVVRVVATVRLSQELGALIAPSLLLPSRMSIAYAYAAVELGISLCGIVSVSMLTAGNGAFALTGLDSGWADFMLNLLLALPVIVIGMNTPLIVHAARQALDNFYRTIRLPYVLNILGAAVGALGGSLVLIEWLGQQGLTEQMAAVLPLLVTGAAAHALTRIHPKVVTAIVFDRVPFGHIDAVAVLFGVGTLAMQVPLFRAVHTYLMLTALSLRDSLDSLRFNQNRHAVPVISSSEP